MALATDTAEELSPVGFEPVLPAGVTELELDESWPDTTFPETVLPTVFTETEPYGKEHVRIAYVTAGDVLALVVHSRGGGEEAARVPFQETLILQDQLLG
ncbi:hypothetical protein OG233_17005 [Streptomyces sp. NBC_01218]|uniref:hypothetical protein n=1 Tax=Streptomyces sp. NBC_01218 TaxID=2903780 RepID=UPI002E0FBBEF|nr:hypothetical protein OG233_17005 [Streptomyces sp. NBC_01218]